ncbi:MAG: lipopolysaccharide biosynthesis protein [Muribaculaceae bacterium]|nr:lipopolysaccharide biosynthesis protein [Muribaculaceae bacterium]
MSVANSKLLAKNTLSLYVRMLVIMAVSFFSVRLLLQELGQEDYGTYNVIGGVVVLFSFLSSALTQSTQRFLSYHLGRRDHESLRKVFSMSINVHFIISIIIIGLAETIGLWFVNNYMKFEPGMMSVVNVIYQFSILTFAIQIMTVPYQALIISHEKMSFFAYFSVLDAALRLSAVMILFFVANNKLIIYCGALVCVALIIWACYYIYCRNQFKGCRYQYCSDKGLFADLISFSGWNMLGGLGNVGASQGVNVIFNVFIGVLVNAAMGVANQVSAAVNSLSSNLLSAFAPQIVKTYAAGETSEFNNLIFRASRVAFLLNFMLGFPLILCCKTILGVWLTEIPEYAVPFTQFVIASSMIDAISGPLWTAAQACGKIKVYMIVVSAMILSNVIAAIVILSFELSPVWVIAYKVGMNMLIHIFRVFYLKNKIEFPASQYMRKVMMKVIAFMAIALPLPILLKSCIHGFWPQIGLFILSIIECVVIGFFVMLTKSEQQFLLKKLHFI